MLEQDLHHRQRILEVGVRAEDNLLHRLVFHKAEGGKDHRNTVCDETKPTDRTHYVKAVELGIFNLDCTEKLVELLFLWRREAKCHRLSGLHLGIEIIEPFAQFIESVRPSTYRIV